MLYPSLSVRLPVVHDVSGAHRQPRSIGR